MKRLHLSTLLFFLLTGAFFAGCAGSSAAKKSAGAPEDSLSVPLRDIFVQGALSSAKGDERKAVELYRQVLEKKPENAAVHFSLSKAFVALSALDSAQNHAEQAVFYDASNKYYRRLLSTIYLNMQDFDKAAEQFEELADMSPADTETLFYLAHAYLAGEKPEEALGALGRILQIDPANENARLQSLWVELKLERYDAAIRTLENMIQRHGASDELQLTLGELYVQSGRKDKAREVFTTLVELHPSNVSAWLALLDMSVESGDRKLFLAEMRRFLDDDTVEFSYKEELVRIFLIRAEQDNVLVEPASIMAEELVRLHRERPSAYVLRGISFRIRKDYRQAIKDMQKALEIDGHNSFAWEELASTFLSQNEYHHVLYTVSQARKEGGLSSLRLSVLEGYALFRLKVYRNTVDVLEKALASGTGDSPRWLLVQAHLTRAMAYDGLHEQLKSISAYREVLEIDPGHALALNNLAYLCAERGEHLEEAMQFIQKALEQEPDNPVFLDTLGWLYYKTGEYEKAREIIEAALEKEPLEPEINEHLAEIYRVLGEETKAREFLDKAREIRENR